MIFFIYCFIKVTMLRDEGYNNNRYDFNLNQPIIQKKPYMRFNDRESKRQNQQNSVEIMNNISFARNIRGRLMSNDPQAERIKQLKMKQYKIELQKQMQEDELRKKQEKDKLAALDQKYERQFYQKIKIESHDNRQRKQQPSYFVVRSAQRNRLKSGKKQNQKLQNQQINGRGNSLELNENKKIKSKYRQQDISKLIITKRGQNPQNAQQMAQRKFQEDRISNLLLFQRNMMRKLNDLKQQIEKTKSHLQTQKQLQSIRLKIRSRPLNLSASFKKQQNEDYFQPPVSNNYDFAKFNDSSYNKKLKNKTKTISNTNKPTINDSRFTTQKQKINQKYNDKNIIKEQNDQIQ